MVLLVSILVVKFNPHLINFNAILGRLRVCSVNAAWSSAMLNGWAWCFSISSLLCASVDLLSIVHSIVIMLKTYLVLQALKVLHDGCQCLLFMKILYNVFATILLRSLSTSNVHSLNVWLLHYASHDIWQCPRVIQAFNEDLLISFAGGPYSDLLILMIALIRFVFIMTDVYLSQDFMTLQFDG